MFENSDAVSFATNGTATYHYPNPDPSYSIPMPSGATLKTDGEKIVGRVEAPAFKVGSVYRQQNGQVVRLLSYSESIAITEHIETDKRGCWLDSSGGRNLSDGRYCHWTHSDHDGMTLLPGELVQRDGQWVAMEEEVGINGLTEAETSATASVAGIADKPARTCADQVADILREVIEERLANTPMLSRDARQPTARERTVMARINLAKALTAEWEAAKKQPALAHPYPFARNFQG